MKKSAEKIIEYIGGIENVISYTHCATRLRFQLMDNGKVNEDVLKTIPEVLGVVNNAGMFQIIIGPKVDIMFHTIQEIFDGTDIKNTNVASNAEAKKDSLIQGVLGYITGAIAPTLPVMVASGLISAMLALATQFGLLTTENSTYVVFNGIANAAFYFLPAIIAVSAAKKLNCNSYIAAFISLSLISSTINGVEGLSLFGITIPTVTYSANIVPVLVMVPVLAILEKFLDKYIPAAITFIVKPLLCVLLITPITLFVLGPIGAVIGAMLANICISLNGLGGIAFGLIALLMPLLVVTGMHTMLIPVIVNEIMTYGFSYLFSCNIAVNFAIAGAALAIGMRAKSKEDRSTGLSTGVTALLSVTEPALYGVIIPFKRTILSVCAASGITGAFIGMLGIKGYAPASVSILTLPIFMGGEMSNFISACAMAILAVVLGFIFTVFIFKEKN